MKPSAAPSGSEPQRRFSKFEEYPPPAGTWGPILKTKKKGQVVVELITHTSDENTGPHGLMGDSLRMPSLAAANVDEDTGKVTYNSDVNDCCATVAYLSHARKGAPLLLKIGINPAKG